MPVDDFDDDVVAEIVGPPPTTYIWFVPLTRAYTRLPGDAVTDTLIDPLGEASDDAEEKNDGEANRERDGTSDTDELAVAEKVETAVAVALIDDVALDDAVADAVLLDERVTLDDADTRGEFVELSDGDTVAERVVLLKACDGDGVPDVVLLDDGEPVTVWPPPMTTVRFVPLTRTMPYKMAPDGLGETLWVKDDRGEPVGNCCVCVLSTLLDGVVVGETLPDLVAARTPDGDGELDADEHGDTERLAEGELVPEPVAPPTMTVKFVPFRRPYATSGEGEAVDVDDLDCVTDAVKEREPTCERELVIETDEDGDDEGDAVPERERPSDAESVMADVDGDADRERVPEPERDGVPVEEAANVGSVVVGVADGEPLCEPLATSVVVTPPVGLTSRRRRRTAARPRPEGARIGDARAAAAAGEGAGRV